MSKHNGDSGNNGGNNNGSSGGNGAASPPLVCFLDIDGIIADFVLGATRWHKRGPKDGVWPPGEFDNIAEIFGMTEADFWGPLNRDFWATLPLTTDGHLILATVERWFGRDNVCLLSSPPLRGEAWDARLEWVKGHFPQYATRLMLGSEKRFAAAPTKYLVDDSDKNVEAFRGAGGNAILFPRPWNKLHAIGDGVELLNIVLGGLLGEPRSHNPMRFEEVAL